MRRRALLVTVGTVTTAGCGWSQTDEPRDPGEIESTDEGSGGQAELASSEGGSGPIEADAEELLLRESDVESDGWSETDVQVTETCNTFARRDDSYSSSLESCAEVFEDEETASIGPEPPSLEASSACPSDPSSVDSISPGSLGSSV